jgi:hypothetical protein
MEQSAKLTGDVQQQIDLLKQSLQGALLPTEIVDGKITKYTKLDFFTEDENENTVEE